MTDRSNLADPARCSTRARRWYPGALALVSLLVSGLAPAAALARPDGPLHPQRVAAVAPRAGNEPLERSADRGTPVAAAAAPLIKAALATGYVDPAGGHPVVRPIETANPYHAR